MATCCLLALVLATVPARADPTVAHMPTPRGGSAVAAFAEKIYVLGGSVTDESKRYADDVLVYLPNDGTVEKLPIALPSPVTAASAATLHGRIFIVGGSTPRGPSSSILSFDPANSTIEQVATLPSGRSSIAAFANETTMFLIGGLADVGRPTDEILAFEPDTRTIKLVGRLPEPLWDAALAWTGETAYVFGGCRTSECPTRQILRFDPASGKATPLGARLPAAMTEGTAVRLGERVFAFGGGKDFKTAPEGRVYALDLRNENVTEVARNALLARGGMSAVAIGGAAYVFGGGWSGDKSVMTAAILKLDERAFETSSETKLPVSMGVALAALVVAAIVRRRRDDG